MEGGRSFSDSGVLREEGGEELRGEATVEDHGERGDGVRVEGDGERGMFADLVLHGPDGLVEGCDGEVDGASANDLAKVGWVVVDGKRDGSGDVGGYGERGTLGVEAEGEDEGTAPCWSELAKGRVRAEDLGLGLAVLRVRGHSR